MVRIPVATAEASPGPEPEQQGFSLGSTEQTFSVFPPAEGGNSERPDDAEPGEQISGETADGFTLEPAVDAAAEMEAVLPAEGDPPPQTEDSPGFTKFEIMPPSAAKTEEVATPQANENTVSAEDEEKFKAREKLMHDAAFAIADIGVEIDDIRSRMAADKKRLKHLLEDLEEASAKLRDLREGKDVQKELPLVDGKCCDISQAVATVTIDAVPLVGQTHHPLNESGNEAAVAAKSPSPPANEDLSWRKVSISELDLASIKGFGKKKQEALAEVAPTLGHLEDLRAQAGPMGLQSVLPNGFGEKICSEIEDKIIQWLTRNRDQKVLAEAVENATAEDYAAVTNEITGPAGGLATDWPSPINDELAAKSEDDFKRRRAIELQEMLANGQLINVVNKDAAQSGKKAADDGEGLDACVWTAGEEQDSWLVGYLSVKSIE